MKEFYIDESGNTGDVINTGGNFSFGNQPLFVLSAIGISNLDGLHKEILRLKRKHKVQLAELKSTKICKNKPGFIVDLVNYIIAQKIPLFIELVDKKYFICCNIVDCIVMPPYFGTTGDGALMARNIFADYIYSKDSNLIYDGFINCCQEPDEEKLLNYMLEIKSYFDMDARLFPSPDMISYHISKNIAESIDDFNIIKQREGDDAFKRFMPIPDKNKNGKDVWLLPNLSSFNSIYARINKYKNGSLSDVTIIHDEQVQFDEIIAETHEKLDAIDGLANVSTYSGDYNFIEKSQLKFGNSKDSVALQVSDILSGLVMRYVQDSIYLNKSVNPQLEEAFSMLKNYCSNLSNTGINFVIPRQKLSSLE